MRKRLMLSMALAAALAAGGAAAQDRTLVLALSCAACHGTDGKSPGAIPAIAGRRAEEIKASLLDFKSGKRAATVMDRLAKGYTDEEIDVLAQYFSTRK